MSIRNKFLLFTIIGILIFLALGTCLLYRDYRSALRFYNYTQQEIALKDYSSGQTMFLGDEMTRDILHLLETDLHFGGLQLHHKEIPLYENGYCITVFAQNDIQQIFLSEIPSYNYMCGDIFLIRTKCSPDLLAYMNQLFNK